MSQSFVTNNCFIDDIVPLKDNKVTWFEVYLIKL